MQISRDWVVVVVLALGAAVVRLFARVQHDRLEHVGELLYQGLEPVRDTKTSKNELDSTIVCTLICKTHVGKTPS